MTFRVDPWRIVILQLVDRREVDAFPPCGFRDHLSRQPHRCANRLRQRRAVDRTGGLELLLIEERQTAIAEGTARATAVAVVVDAGDEARIARALDEPIEFSVIHAQDAVAMGRPREFPRFPACQTSEDCR
jgi:hypothetical protein